MFPSESFRQWASARAGPCIDTQTPFAIQSDTGNSKFRFWVFAKNVSKIDRQALQCVMFPLFTFKQHYNFKIFNLSLEKEIRWVVSTRFDRRWSRAGLRCVLLPLAGAYIDVGARCVCANQNLWGNIRRKAINCDRWVHLETQLRRVWRNAKRRENFLSDWTRHYGFGNGSTLETRDASWITFYDLELRCERPCEASFVEKFVATLFLHEETKLFHDETHRNWNRKQALLNPFEELKVKWHKLLSIAAFPLSYHTSQSEWMVWP